MNGHGRKRRRDSVLKWMWRVQDKSKGHGGNKRKTSAKTGSRRGRRPDGMRGIEKGDGDENMSAWHNGLRETKLKLRFAWET